jgi:hypothetical protein
MLKLYRSARHMDSWIVYSPETGWVIFPDVENGWEDRRRAGGLDPMHLRQVPVSLAAKTGLPAADLQRAA